MADTALSGEVRGTRWYHTIELPGGLVTPGEYDLRASVRRVLLPTSLAGRRCLDVGTHDGFWAYEMERRGAAEVLAIDLDDPSELDWPGPPAPLTAEMTEDRARRRSAFDIAHDALGSHVVRRSLSVYDLDPAMVGTFDEAFIGTLLHHLRDPIRALRSVRSVTTGGLTLTAVISVARSMLHPRRPLLELMGTTAPFWEVPNRAALLRQLTSAGWRVERVTRPFFQGYGPGRAGPTLDFHPRQWGEIPRRALLHFGALHVSVRAVPA